MIMGAVRITTEGDYASSFHVWWNKNYLEVMLILSGGGGGRGGYDSNRGGNDSRGGGRGGYSNNFNNGSNYDSGKK